MSSRAITREADAAASDVSTRRLQHKWAILLRRAKAREAALHSALAHARGAESELRLQLERERQRHTLETGLLRERLRRLEQCLLSYVAAGRVALRSTLPAMRTSANTFGARAQLPSAPSFTPSPGSAAPALAPPAPAPFDPVATVASLLPLSPSRSGAPEADISGALDRLQAVMRNSGIDHADPAPGAAPAASERSTPAPAAPTGDGELAHDRSAGSDTPWFPRAFRRLVEEDPTAAGRLFLQLLPAQGLVWPEDVAYRIAVLETGSLAVSARAGASTVRPLLESELATGDEPTLRTDLAGLARAVAGRRGLSRVGARIASARNRHLRPLRALAAAPLQLSDFKRAGVQVDPVLLLRLLALAIDPEWTAAEVFTVACRWHDRVGGDCYIHVVERAPVAVTSVPPLSRVAATLSCDPRAVLDILLADAPLEDSLAQVSGERSAVASVLEWFQRVDATATKLPAEPADVAGSLL